MAQRSLLSFFGASPKPKTLGVAGQAVKRVHPQEKPANHASEEKRVQKQHESK